jgi:hypothetical protein
VGPSTGQDDVEKRKFLTLSGLELRSLSRHTDYDSVSYAPGPGINYTGPSSHKKNLPGRGLTKDENHRSTLPRLYQTAWCR